MTIQANFPNVQPSLLLDFANAKQLPPSVTFTRATTATYYNGSTTALAEQNLLTYSQEFDNAVWVKASVTVTANTTTAPDGTTTADTVTHGSATGDISENSSIGATTATFSFFIKYIDVQWVRPVFGSGSNNVVVWFDIQNGVLGSNANNGSATYISSSITSVGSGWYRCVIVATLTSSSGNYVQVNSASANGSNSRIAGSYYLWGAQLEQRAAATAYTATTSQATTNYIPVLLTAGGGQPRFDHNPTTSESLGLLIEEQRTNLLVYSNTLSNWGSIGSQASGTTIVPSGELSGVNANRTGPNNLYTIVSVSNATTYTFSVYAKAGFGSQVNFGVESGFGTYAVAGFNLSSGIAPSPPSGTTVSMTSVGNGWYRLTMTGTTTSTSVTLHIAATTADYTNGVWVWGAQLEAGAFATSYISTNGAAATRAPDFAAMTGVNFSSWFNAGEGTVVYELETARPGSNTFSFNFDIGNSSSSQNVLFSSAGLGSNLYVTSGNSNQVNINAGVTPVAGTFFKTALFYEVNNFAVSVNGNAAVTDTTGVVPYGLARLVLGTAYDLASTNYIDGHIKKFAYYPQAVTAAQLAALSS